MQKALCSFLASSRKRRCLLVGVILRLLRLLRNIENEEMQRNYDMLDSFEPRAGSGSRYEYIAIEEECASCEYALSVLESAIEDLECAY